MSDPSNGERTPASPGPSVLDPVWEDVLRAGQEAQGGAGSVEEELAVVRLFRHAVSPESPSAAELGELWSEIEGEITPAPWWTKLLDWRVATGAATVAAAAAVIVLAWPGGSVPALTEPEPEPESIAAVTPTAKAAELEAMFSILQAPAREALARGVTASRGSMRSDLLALATRDAKTMGGAP